MSYTDAFKTALQLREIDFTEYEDLILFHLHGDNIIFPKRENNIFQMIILDICDVYNMDRDTLLNSLNRLNGEHSLTKTVVNETKLWIIAETITMHPREIEICFDMLMQQLWTVRNLIIDNICFGFLEFVENPELKTERSMFAIDLTKIQK